MWKPLMERFHIVKVRVLHPRIPKFSSVDILRGLPEGSRLSPTLPGIFVADLIHELKLQFPSANITHTGGFSWIGRIFYVVSTDDLELQMMINTCQTWSEKARMQLNADKTKILCFQGRNSKPHKPEMRENDHEKLRAVLFGQQHSTSYSCTYTTPTPRIGFTVTQDIYPHSCKRYSNLTILVSNSTPWWIWKLRCHPFKKRQTILTFLSSLSPIPSTMTSTTPTPSSAAHQLNCLTFGNPVSSHASSSTSATYQMRHKLRHYRLASTSHPAPPCMCLPHLYFVFPTCISRRICNLHNLDSDYTPFPPPQSSISSSVFGSHCYKQCLWIRWKTACRML